MSADGTRRPPQGALGKGPPAQEESPRKGAGGTGEAGASAAPLHTIHDLSVQLLADELVDDARVGFPLGLLHHLADEEAE
jgi:hypothetical protein